ncbi:chemotaxis response regulator protein-glutamate methylesterase of group 1 operon [Thalassotalea insulae]|uniref:Protein-glutamate methylesterase/protein-glutamine glutaminase n=1 Tax=Thalassotalea insulae TaxID=2056778 RepID=A0ABQ6GRP0_9GAMM|nr:chemotaxis response regulator protein-glutamate methylesterase [Thalassotalea insulae]GLX76821.1 chemotaxis response regulator protein-glutamate methylesterase of group 1 operon [Thalassotalea insulae]
MRKIKVLIVDDSVVIRNLVSEILSSDSQIEVVGEAEDPYIARELIKKLNPDVLTLDVKMPKMDGITFLENLMRLRPMPVVMLSTLTSQGADITLRALELGALDFIEKPSFETLIASKDNFKEQLLTIIKSAMTVEQKKYSLVQSVSDINLTQPLPFNGTKRENHLIAIGASTGGTEAIKSVLVNLPSNSPAIVITQHIPKTFSARFAERLNESCHICVQEAKHRQKIKTGYAYIAPGDQHLKVTEKNGSLFCVLEDSALVNRHKPSVDVLFHSLLPMANNVQAVLLTGMGNDGARAMLALKMQGARTLVQDKNTSLIWGMPGSAVQLNAHTDICELKQIPELLLSYAELDKKQMKEAF